MDIFYVEKYVIKKLSLLLTTIYKSPTLLFHQKILMKKLLLLLLVIVSGNLLSFAQTTVTGKITDKNNETLTGVTIAEKGSTNGAYSDENGSYSIIIKTSCINCLQLHRLCTSGNCDYRFNKP